MKIVGCLFGVPEIEHPEFRGIFYTIKQSFQSTYRTRRYGCTCWTHRRKVFKTRDEETWKKAGPAENSHLSDLLVWKVKRSGDLREPCGMTLSGSYTWQMTKGWWLSFDLDSLELQMSSRCRFGPCLTADLAGSRPMFCRNPPRTNVIAVDDFSSYDLTN